LLIEPQREIVPFLRENYADHPDATIFGGAIGTGETLLLFRVKPELWNSYNPPYMKDAPAYRVPSGFASSSIEHVRRHAEGNFRIDARLEDCIEGISVPCVTLHALISRLSWAHDVDVLQIDAEGADDEVIYASDTDRLRPRLINYERSHLTEERRQRLEAFLTCQGYRILHWSVRIQLQFCSADGACVAELAQQRASQRQAAAEPKALQMSRGRIIMTLSFFPQRSKW
jgi:FkbM family methyltransferase